MGMFVSNEPLATPVGSKVNSKNVSSPKNESANPTDAPLTKTSTAAPGTFPAFAWAAVRIGIPVAAKSARSAVMNILASSTKVTRSLFIMPLSSFGSSATLDGVGTAKFSISRS